MTLMVVIVFLGQSLRFYCEDCETAICSSCTDIEHRDHYTKRMAEAVEDEKKELRSLVDQAYTQVCLQNETTTWFCLHFLLRR